MEVYTPIPESSLWHAPRGLRRTTTVVLVAVLLLGAWKILDFTFSEPIANKHIRVGVVETRFGPALAKCGGAAGFRCGEGSALIFASCSREVREYFGGDQDARARELLAARPPSGDRWEFGCWSTAYWGAFPTGPPAVLKPA